ncbi:MAG: isoleucine--tRNA ligase [Candidatus Rokubacteria bacterium]|nr:isoleucine--tRNA ligase [Candidatus Rokubacteria bacterium]
MDYKATLNLPRTDFPMRANLSRLEPEMLRRWEATDIYMRLRETAGDRPLWILHDGPPYANGHIHMGHVLNKVLKDFIVKSRSMLGQNAVFVPGWDCHGLPIEHQVDKELGLDQATVDIRRAMDPVEKRRRCREYALRFIDIQREEFKRLGVFGNWKNPYLTMASAYQAVIVREFGRFVGRGIVYKGLKPVHWCMHCKTALAQAEVEYDDQTTPSVWVKFPLKSAPAALAPHLRGRPAFAVIWTTTPWTLPANLAIAVHPTQRYVAVEVAGEIYIVARALVNDFLRLFTPPPTPEVLASFDGSELVGRTFGHPWIDREGPIAAAEFVAMDQGTGLVHIAPGHGEEDYELGKQLGLRIYNPVDDDGRFIAEVERFAGMTVWEANPKIIEHLAAIGMLVATRQLTHTYPHCWRCKNPTLFRATEQWFISLDKDGLRQRALRAIRQDVRWIPAWGQERIAHMVATRPDWCISRQRVWGVPIVAFYCRGCEALLLEERLVEYVAAIMRDGAGADEWYVRDAKDLLPAGTRCLKCGGAEFRKETDILDVWFDAGCSHAAVLETRSELRWPAEMYLEGSDQHRGWFHSSLLEAVGTREAAPYREVLTHGFLVDGDGRKMSKSLGNVIAPQDVIAKHGAEILRLWVAAEDYTEDIRLPEPEIMGQLTEAYRRIRNTWRFLLGNLRDFDPERDRIPYARLDEVDRWALLRLGRLITRVRKAYEDYQFHTVFHSLHNFCAVDLSALYLDILKDRLYTSAAADPARRAAQTACYEILLALTRLMAPVLTFTAEEVWGYLPGRGKAESVHLVTFPEAQRDWLDETLERDWERLLEVRREVARALEAARRGGAIGSGLEARVLIHRAPEDLGPLLRRKEPLLRHLFIISQVDLSGSPAVRPLATHEGQEIPGLLIEVERARGTKCERCWVWSEGVGADPEHPALCERCAPVVRALG